MKRLILLPLLAVTLALAACGGSSTNSSTSSGGSSSKSPSASGCSTSGHTTITVWQGDTEVEAAAFKTLVAEFNRTHPNITVNSQFYGNSDYALQKVLAAIAGGKPPDISYLYGSWAPNIATNPQLVPLNKFIDADPSFNWNDFFPAERKVATVGNSIIGVPRWSTTSRSSTTRRCSSRRASRCPRPPGRGATSRTPPSSSPTRPRSSSAGPTSTTPARTRSGASGRCCGRPAARSSAPMASRRPLTPPPASRH